MKILLNPFPEKVLKKLCSQIIHENSVFAALCFKVKNRDFSEKLIGSLFKNGHFKNVQFRKTAEQIYSVFFGGNLLWAIDGP